MKGMRKMNWAKEVAMRIIEERPNEEVYTVASGVSPSGFVHIGNFREIVTPCGIEPQPSEPESEILSIKL